MGHLTEQYACVVVPAFAAQARLRLRPAQAMNAVAILQGEPPLQTVCSVTRAAERLGVSAGMTRAELDVFPELLMLPRSVTEERATRSAMLQGLSVFTPRMEVWPHEHMLICLLDMTGSRLLFGDARSYAKSIVAATQAMGLHVRLAISHNAHTAACAAPFAKREPVIVGQGMEAKHLARLPLSALELTDEMAARFELWGIRRLGELAALPEQELVARIGQQGKRLRALARGEHPHLFVPEEPVFSLEEAIEFDEPEERLDALLFVIGPILDQMIVRAQAHALSLASVTFQLLLERDGEHTRTLKPALPVADRVILLKLLHLDLQGHPPPCGVMGVRIVAEPGERGKVQMGLFSPQLPESTRLDVTLAQIEAMVGEGRVGSPRLLDTHHPEDFTVERFRVEGRYVASEVQRVCSAVLRRVRPPVQLSVWLDARTGRPNLFFFEGRRYAVSIALGPWRRSGEWWSQRVWSHEEWDVSATAGTSALLCVLAHDLLQKCWQLEALYD